MSAVMDIVNRKSEGLPANLRTFMRKLVIRAYETAHFTSESYRRDAIQNFATEVSLGCYKALQK